MQGAAGALRVLLGQEAPRGVRGAAGLLGGGGGGARRDGRPGQQAAGGADDGGPAAGVGTGGERRATGPGIALLRRRGRRRGKYTVRYTTSAPRDLFRERIAEQVVGRGAEQGRRQALFGLGPESVTPSVGPAPGTACAEWRPIARLYSFGPS
jgi:hypothetical protein